jgi:hypothetical protein
MVRAILFWGMGKVQSIAISTRPTKFSLKLRLILGDIPYTNVLGPVAAVPLGSTIGSNVVSSLVLLDTSNYCWFSGITNNDDLSQSYGNHEDLGMIVVNDGIVGDPPIADGDIVGQEGAIAVQFYINGQPHFGYIHFDFRPQHGGYPSGTAGYIYGWAYETQPNTPIVANSLGTLPIDDCKIVNFGFFRKVCV